MSFFLLTFSLIVIASLASTQTFNLKFDHYSITVKDLETSYTFYKEVLHLPEIENKTQKETIRWFSMGEHAELHIIEGNTEEIHMIKRVHMALATHSFDALLSDLDAHDISYSGSRGQHPYSTRPDGIRQVYFQDPDGYWIEVNDVA